MNLLLTSYLFAAMSLSPAPQPPAALGASCAAGAQSALHSGLLALYNFEYVEADEDYAAASAADPQCAIAEWGRAMTNWHELWNAADATELATGWREAQTARSREKYASPLDTLFVEAAAAYFAPAAEAPTDGKPGSATDGKNATLRTESRRTPDERAAAYEDKMRQLHRAFPDSVNGTVFFALAIIAHEHGTHDERLTQAREAAALLEPVFAAHEDSPTLPGAAHFLIHAYDQPELASQGLAAARAYAKMAPDSPHALHMPAHIFAQLGLWNEDVASNVASYDAAKAQGGSHAMEKAHEEMHALDFLQYALLQQGNFAKAAEITKVAGDIGRAHNDLNSDYSILWLPIRQVVEQQDWQQAQSVPAPAADAGHYWKASYAWFQVMTAAHLQPTDPAAAANAMHTLESECSAIRKDDDSADTQTASILLAEAQAWDAMMHGDGKQAVSKMQEAVQQENEPGGYGGFRKPAEEMLADLELQLGDKVAAHAAYAETLKTHPHRRLAEAGLQASA